MCDARAVDADLAGAVAVWTGHGSHFRPLRDDGAVVERYGDARGRDLLVALRSLEADFYASDAYLTEPDHRRMVDRAVAEFRARHPDAPGPLVDALAWCYSYDNK